MRKKDKSTPAKSIGKCESCRGHGDVLLMKCCRCGAIVGCCEECNALCRNPAAYANESTVPGVSTDLCPACGAEFFVRGGFDVATEADLRAHGLEGLGSD
jgi:hypothetical protein